MHKMATALLEKETLTSVDVDEIMAGGKESETKKKPARKKKATPPKEVQAPAEPDAKEPETDAPEEGKE